MTPAAPASLGAFQRIDASSIVLGNLSQNEDVEMTDPDTDILNHVILAIDFGTTFSSVAYARITESTREIGLGLADVHCVEHYPDDRPNTVGLVHEYRQDVPTELWYPPKHLSLPYRNDGSAADVQGNQQGSATNLGSGLRTTRSVWSDGDDDEVSDALPIPNPVVINHASHPYWGFEVQKQLRRMDAPKDNNSRITRFKLMLDEKSEQTETIREELSHTLKALKRSRQINKPTDVITEYLRQLFLHTKRELSRWLDFDDQTPIEFVLCVPAIWPSKACRVMQTAITVAAHASGLRQSDSNSLSNLFIISEPEGAAACVLEESQIEIFAGERILIIDAGGGTVDAITYEVTKSRPLRLQSEVVTPATELCGASYINERFKILLMDKLEAETYLIKNDKTIERIVEAKVIEFENGDKRIIDVTKDTSEMEPIYIDDLRPNSAMGLHKNRLDISRKEMKSLFKESLEGAEKVLRDQLQKAKLAQAPVQKVILIGGFGKSPSLQSYLRMAITEEQISLGHAIEFLIPRIPSTVVARGAVLRAYNKEDGPERITRCSYGFLRTEPFEPDAHPQHKNVRSTVDKVDGERYIENTIDWLIKKGKSLGNREEVCIRVKHTFRLKEKKFICVEELYVSDQLHDSHYKKSHDMNKEAEIAGKIEVDMTFLRDDGHIEPVLPSEFSIKSRAPYWAVEFDLVMVVEGRSLHYEARWPPSGDEMRASQPQKVHAHGQVSIAAAFKPGTA